MDEPTGSGRPGGPPLPAPASRSGWSPGRRSPVLRRLAAGGAALVLVAAGVYAWRRHGSATSYQTVPVSRGAVQRAITASGTVNPVTTVQVGTYVSGVIQSIKCDFNTRVRAGQRCAKIDPRPYQTVVDQETAALASARAQLAKDQANLALAQLQFDRAAKLLAQQMVSQDALDTAQSALTQAKAQIAVDQANVAQHQAALSAARVNLAYTDITSPVDGTVVSRNVTQGQTVAASFQTPTLFLIATDLTQMQVDTNVSESDIGNVRLGDRVLFTVEAYPDRVFSGSVVQRRLAPQSVQNVITYDAVVAVSNADLSLVPGMTAAVRIVTAERQDVLRVPDQALRYVPGGLRAPGRRMASPPDAEVGAATAAPRAGRVWRLQDGRPAATALRLGLEDDAYTEVIGGELRAGDPVIVGETTAADSAAAAPRMPRL